MVSFSLKTRVKPDGELKVAIPTGLPETDVDVLLVIQPLPAGREGDGTGKSWPDGFFEETDGCLAEAPLVRGTQLEQETREKLP